MEDIPMLASLMERITLWEDGNALHKLDSLANSKENPTLSKMATKYLLNVGYNMERDISTLRLSEFKIEIIGTDSILTEMDSLKIKLALINSIKNEDNVWRIAYAFVLLREFIDHHLSNYDFSAIRRMEKELNNY